MYDFFTLSYLFIRRVPWYVLCFFCLYALHCCLKFYSKHVAQHNWACWQLLWGALLLNLTTIGPKSLSNSIRNSKFMMLDVSFANILWKLTRLAWNQEYVNPTHLLFILKGIKIAYIIIDYELNHVLIMSCKVSRKNFRFTHKKKCEIIQNFGPIVVKLSSGLIHTFYQHKKSLHFHF